MHQPHIQHTQRCIMQPINWSWLHRWVPGRRPRCPRPARVAAVLALRAAIAPPVRPVRRTFISQSLGHRHRPERTPASGGVLQRGSAASSDARARSGRPWRRLRRPGRCARSLRWPLHVWARALVLWRAPRRLERQLGGCHAHRLCLQPAGGRMRRNTRRSPCFSALPGGGRGGFGGRGGGRGGFRQPEGPPERE